MINNLYSNANPYIIVSNPGASYVSSGPMSGQMRYNTGTNQPEVWNGTNWQSIGGTASIVMTEEFLSIINWAKQEMLRTNNIKSLAAQSVTVADALADYELAAEKLQVIVALLEKEAA